MVQNVNSLLLKDFFEFVEQPEAFKKLTISQTKLKNIHQIAQVNHSALPTSYSVNIGKNQPIKTVHFFVM